MALLKNGRLVACALGLGLLASGCPSARSSGEGDGGIRVSRISAKRRVYWTSHRRVRDAAVKACRDFGIRDLNTSRKTVIGGQVPRHKAKSSDVTMHLAMRERGDADSEARILVFVEFFNAPAGGRDDAWGNEILSAMDKHLGTR